MTAGLDTAHRPARLPTAPHLLLRAAHNTATGWRCLAAMVHTFTVLSWRALCAGLLSMTGVQAAMMIAAGNRWYHSPSYRLFELVPGGMRTWGIALAALWGLAMYSYGQARTGRGQPLRRALASLAGWYVLWVLLILGTWFIDWQVYSANTIPVLLFVSWLSVLVGRATPPDRT